MTNLDGIRDELREVQSLLRLVLLTAGGSLPTTTIGPNFLGSTIGTTDEYRPLYKNNYNRLIAVKVTAEFVVPGAAVRLSLTTDKSNNGQVDLLSSSGKVISDTLWLRPEDTLYVNTADTVFSLNGSILRVLLFDPLSYRTTLSSGV